MNQDDLIKLRHEFRYLLLTELVIRNSGHLEALMLRLNGQHNATFQDGIRQTQYVIEAMIQRNEQIFLSQPLPPDQKQMNADEFRDAGEFLKRMAKELS